MTQKERQIRIPLPQVPQGLEPAVTNHLYELQRAVEANLNALFGYKDIDGAKVIDGTLTPGSLSSAIDFDVPLLTDITFSVDSGVPKWTGGTLQFGGAQYTIAAWTSGDSTSSSRGIYWEVGSSTVLSATNTPANVAGRWFVAFFDGSAIFPANANVIVHGGLVQASTITANEIAASTITADEIAAGTITTNELTFTPLFSSGSTTQIVATINASTEGVTINADTISIDGSTTFSSGYDPSLKVDEVGGSYDSAASGARVRIFPDADTGIVVTDDTANEVFKVIVGGTAVGDVIIGNYTGNQGCKWDKSAGTFVVRGSITAEDITSGTIATDRLVVENLDLVGTTDLGSAISAGTITGVNGTFTSLTAKDSIQIGPDDSDYSMNIKVANGVSTLLWRWKSGVDHFEIWLGSNGWEAFYRSGAWPNQATYYKHAGWGGPSRVAIFYDLRETSGKFGAFWSFGNFGSDASTQITYDTNGVVTVPTAALSGTIADAHLNPKHTTGTYQANNGNGSKIVPLGLNADIVLVRCTTNDHNWTLVDSDGANNTGGTNINASLSGTDLVIADSENSNSINNGTKTYRFQAFETT